MYNAPIPPFQKNLVRSYFYLNFDTVINLHLKSRISTFRFFFFFASNKENIFRGSEQSEMKHRVHAYTSSKLISHWLIYTHDIP